MEELHMGITERIYKKIEKHAVKICFVLAVLLASLITTGVYYRAEAAEAESAEDTEGWVRAHIDEIEEVGRAVVAEAGADYPVSAAVTTCWFPDKSYGDITFPAGNYEALRIEIGAAEGHNWWCVLYPGLCFMDTVNAVVPDEGKQKLKNVLTEEEYSRVTADSDFKIGWFFWQR